MDYYDGLLIKILLLYLAYYIFILVLITIFKKNIKSI